MTDLNDEMKTNAEEAITAAKRRFELKLDYSDQSIVKLENLLGLVYWGFYNNNNNIVEIKDAAKIWGSYLGEYMRRKWDGTWLLKDSDQLVSINTIEFSPIKFVFQKITSHPEYTLNDYISKLESRIISSTNIPEQPKVLSDIVSQPEKKIINTPPKKKRNSDKRLLTTISGIEVLLLIVFLFILGFVFFQKEGVPLFGSITLPNGSNTEPTLEKVKNKPATYITQLLYLSPTPSETPFSTETPIPTSVPTDTQKPSTPTETQTLIPAFLPSRTPIPFYPTYTSIPATKRPRPSATQVPQPTATDLPVPTATEKPVVTVTCKIDPSKVPVDGNVTLTFIATFSPPTSGMSFTTQFDPTYPEQSGCNGVDNDGDGVAFCDGSSGKLPESATVYVTFKTSAGNCIASYSSR
jgi:hypothetical protein